MAGGPAVPSVNPMDASSGVSLAPIETEDAWEVGGFLHEHLSSRISVPAWAAAIVPPWAVVSPNHGFQLRSGGRIVGVQLAFYSRREIAGEVQDFCNLGARCVLEHYRAHGPRLLRALLSQRDYTFTDLSPRGEVVAINERLHFESLDTTTALVPNLPVTWPHAARVISDPDAIGDYLEGAERHLFDDHRRAAASIHLVLTRGTERCYVVLRRDRCKDLPLLASVLYVGNPAMLRRRMGDLGQHLLLHHAVPFTLIETRLLGGRPHGAVLLSSPRPKMFRSTRVSAGRIDNMYSELALVGC